MGFAILHAWVLQGGRLACTRARMTSSEKAPPRAAAPMSEDGLIRRTTRAKSEPASCAAAASLGGRANSSFCGDSAVPSRPFRPSYTMPCQFRHSSLSNTPPLLCGRQYGRVKLAQKSNRRWQDARGLLCLEALGA